MKFKRYDNPLWALLGALVLLFIFSWSTSPLYYVYGGDSPMFQLMGLCILQGDVPYVDLFDHKGPLIFFVDALGYLTNLGKTGIFLFQIISATVSIVFFYKLARLFTDSDRKAFICAALTLIPFADFITEGNQCEEWMVPFVTISLYFLCKYFLAVNDWKNSGTEGDAPQHPVWHAFFYGIACAVLFYIRPNDAAMQFGAMIISCVILWIGIRQARQILPNAAMFLAGFILVSLPIFGYFWSKDAVYDFIYGMIIHNMKYAGGTPFNAGSVGIILVPSIICGVNIWKSAKSGQTSFCWLFGILIALTIPLIGRSDYYHYLMPFLPTVAICYALCLDGSKWEKFVLAVSILFALFSFNQWKCIVKAVRNRDAYETFYSQTDALLDQVPEDERQHIWNYNLSNYWDGNRPTMVSTYAVFLHKGVTPGNKFFCPFHLKYLEPGQEIFQNSPKWALVQDDQYNKDIPWIEAHYDLYASTPAEPVCEIKLYRLKDED